MHLPHNGDIHHLLQLVLYDQINENASFLFGLWVVRLFLIQAVQLMTALIPTHRRPNAELYLHPCLISEKPTARRLDDDG